jgi:predicted ABC-type ATPase
MPNLYIIAGPNGAGKTTYAQTFLLEEVQCREFVNADMIAAGLSPFAPEQVAFSAGRIMLQRMDELLVRRQDFAFETTLSGYGYIQLLHRMREAGYRIRLDFLWIPDLSITRQRVRSRVAKGGHNIPEEVQQRRFGKGVRLLIGHYRPLLDEWRIYDNAGESPRLVVSEKDGVLLVQDYLRLAAIEAATKMALMESKPGDRVEEPSALPLQARGDSGLRAMRRAYANAVLENLHFGLPVIQWRDGRVIEVPPQLLEAHARRILEVNGEPLSEEEDAKLLHASRSLG